MTIPEGHDRAAKRLLGNLRTMRDLLRAFVPGDWVADLDFATLRPLPAEHVGAELRRRRGDLLWTAELKGGGAVVIAVEAQSTPDLHMAARMMTLTGLICESHAEALGPVGRLPAVLPIVVYTGRRRWSPVRDLAEQVGPPPGLTRYVAGPRYLLLEVGVLAEQVLPQRNLMSALVRLEAATSAEALLQALGETLAWLGDDELAPVFLDWVSEVLMPLRFPDAGQGAIDQLKEGKTMLAERAKEWTEQWFADGQRDMAVRIAGLKFGNAAAERLSPIIERISDHDVLGEVGDWVIQCSDAAELLARAETAAGSGNGQTSA